MISHDDAGVYYAQCLQLRQTLFLPVVFSCFSPWSKCFVPQTKTVSCSVLAQPIFDTPIMRCVGQVSRLAATCISSTHLHTFVPANAPKNRPFVPNHNPLNVGKPYPTRMPRVANTISAMATSQHPGPTAASMGGNNPCVVQQLHPSTLIPMAITTPQMKRNPPRVLASRAPSHHHHQQAAAARANHHPNERKNPPLNR